MILTGGGKGLTGGKMGSFSGKRKIEAKGDPEEGPISTLAERKSGLSQWGWKEDWDKRGREKRGAILIRDYWV